MHELPWRVHFKRVIPCLDVDAGRVVKGVEFLDIRDAGDPVELAAHYDREGADELVFLDITATHEKRETIVELARAPPTTCSCRSRSAAASARSADAQAVLDAGADKVSVNSAALAAPGADRRAGERVRRAVRRARDRRQGARRRTAGSTDARRGGRPTSRAGARRPDATSSTWAREGVERGAGEILLTSMDRDGTSDGYDLALTARSATRSSVPVIASGGAGELDHLAEALRAGADAVLCASIFHYGRYTIAEAKAHLAAAGIAVRVG